MRAGGLSGCAATANAPSVTPPPWTPPQRSVCWTSSARLSAPLPATRLMSRRHARTSSWGHRPCAVHAEGVSLRHRCNCYVIWRHYGMPFCASLGVELVTVRRCQNDYMLLKSAAAIRRQLFAIEAGKCQKCKLDTESLLRNIKSLPGSAAGRAERQRIIVKAAPEWGRNKEALKAANRLARHPVAGAPSPAPLPEPPRTSTPPHWRRGKAAWCVQPRAAAL